MVNEADIQRCQKATGEVYTDCKALGVRLDIMECVRADGKKDYVNVVQQWYVKDSSPEYDQHGILFFPGDIVGHDNTPLQKHHYADGSSPH